MAGDPPPSLTPWSASKRFQSAPAIDGGRSTQRAVFLWSPYSFQSAPAIDGGRSLTDWIVQRVEAQPMFQSAPAIDGGRSRGCSTGIAESLGFNPRPPSMAGDPL